MIANLETLDLAAWLASLRAEPATATRSGNLPGHALEVVRVMAGELFEGTAHPHARVLVVMDGLGTITVDDWRATLGPGLAAGVPAKRRWAVQADGPAAIVVLLVGPPMPNEVPAIEAEPSSGALTDSGPQSEPAH